MGKGDSDLRPLSAISSIALWRETGSRKERGILVPGKRDISSSLSSFPLSPSAENRIRIEFRQKGGGGVDFPTKMTKKLVIFSLVGKKLVLRNNIIPNAVYPF